MGIPCISYLPPDPALYFRLSIIFSDPDIRSIRLLAEDMTVPGHLFFLSRKHHAWQHTTLKMDSLESLLKLLWEYLEKLEHRLKPHQRASSRSNIRLRLGRSGAVRLSIRYVFFSDDSAIDTALSFRWKEAKHA